jgi:glycosyltransferase involved in cell wall biosynthesis
VDFVFSGGNSLRDYQPLVEAARCLPELKFVFATKLLNGKDNLPPNVESRPVSHPEFVALMSASSATITPIQPGLRRAAGQQTYLNSMWLGKTTIVNDTLGVRDHIRHKETGLIVDGSPEGYVEALTWVFNPQNRDQVRQLNAAARKEVQERFAFENHVRCLLEIMDEDLREQMMDG